MKLKPHNNKKVWVLCVSVIIISFLSITAVPYFIFDNLAYSPTLFMTWLTVSVIILSLAVSFENLREFRIARKQDHLPQVFIEKVKYSSPPRNLLNSMNHASSIKLEVLNTGNGPAVNFKSELYLRDADNLSWIKTEFSPSNLTLEAKKSLSLNTSHGNQTSLSGKDFQIIITLIYTDIFGDSNTRTHYFNESNGNFNEVAISTEPDLKNNKKFEFVKIEAIKEAQKLSKDNNSNISVDIYSDYDGTISFTVKKNGEILNYYEASLIFSANSIIKNAFTLVNI